MQRDSRYALTLGILLGGCLASDTEWNTSSTQDAVPGSITWEQFRSTVQQEPWDGGAFITDGDIRLFGEAGIRSFYDQHIARTEGALTVRNILGADVLWPKDQRFQLTYCVSDGFGTRKSAIVTAMEQATTSWSDAIAVKFTYLAAEDANCTASNGKVLFDVRPVTATFFAASFFPDSPRDQRELLVTDAAFTTTAGRRDLQGIMRHEVGHILGFRHEHIHIVCTGEGTSESRQVTSYDVDSVMHYPQCRPSGTGGYRQTALDLQGAISLYGAAGT